MTGCPTPHRTAMHHPQGRIAPAAARSTYEEERIR
jgi:hypothetical protein